MRPDNAIRPTRTGKHVSLFSGSAAIQNEKMNIFITGASGYIGGSVAIALQHHGHHIIGLTRSREKAHALQQLGISTIVGSLDDSDLIETAARSSDAVINAADSDHAGAAHALIRALDDSGKRLIHTSGSSIVGDSAAG